MSSLKTDKFKQLQRDWYKRLKDEGFNDIEQEDGALKEWASSMFKHHYNEIQFKAKEDYYRLAAQFLNDYNFKDERERLLWELHSEGMSVKNIIKELKSKGFKAYKDLVLQEINRLVKEMTNKCR